MHLMDRPAVQYHSVRIRLVADTLIERAIEAVDCALVMDLQVVRTNHILGRPMRIGPGPDWDAFAQMQMESLPTGSARAVD